MQDLQLSDLRAHWRDHLKATNKIDGTVAVYLRALDQLIAHAGDPPATKVTRRTVEAFIAHQLDRLAPTTVSIDYRALQQFFKWALAEQEIDADPMVAMKAPIVPKTNRPVISRDDIRKLAEVCRGRDFASRRDLAIIRLLEASGARLSEITNLRTDELDTARLEAHVLGKGRKRRTIPFDHVAANAINSYLRIRRHHPRADEPALWLGHVGPLTPNGLYQAIRRRARQAGVKVHPHLFRHTFAHEWLQAGGNEGDLMQIAGWDSPAMPRVYGASVANVRALANYRKIMDERRRH